MHVCFHNNVKLINFKSWELAWLPMIRVNCVSLHLKSWQLRKRADEQKRIKKKSLQKTSKVETLSARPFMRLFKI